MNRAFICSGILQQRLWTSVVPTSESLGRDSQQLMTLAARSFRSSQNKKTIICVRPCLALNYLESYFLESGITLYKHTPAINSADLQKWLQKPML